MLPEKDLQTLLDQYQEGKASPEERLLVEQWYEQLDAGSEQLWSSPGQEPAVKEELYMVILQQLKAAGNKDAVTFLPGKKRGLYVRLFRLSRVAALLIAVAGLGWFGWSLYTKQPGETVSRPTDEKDRPGIRGRTSVLPAKMLTVRSGETGYKKCQLPDGSTAWLNAGSAISYPDHFTALERMVRVERGEVFFKVLRDTLHPFRVHTGSVITTVLGTSFLVKQGFQQNTVEVSVKTGIVKVEKTNQTGASALVGRNLLPGDQLSFDTTANTYGLKKIPAGVIAAFIQGRLVYEDASLEEIVYDINHKYHISIQFDHEQLKNCHYRISIDDIPLTDCLQILSTLTNTRIEKQAEGHYKIIGQACN
ncbi:DUF4974 domain-containing protein [Paraflavitalea soli]|uniref:DUF4974 domain-containing protein n=1 Tax=Paraflavitalea soli TaxID=2315862 RepID=A0A3B7MM47_9BACT|nr:FecR family protein [Paraflavitalea soli]AXY74373.1 DUF4974 domain-containing protein [Paraflavitalea soli]